MAYAPPCFDIKSQFADIYARINATSGSVPGAVPSPLGPSVQMTFGTGPGPDQWQTPAYCSSNPTMTAAMTSMCMPGDDASDCGPTGSFEVGSCSQLAAPGVVVGNPAWGNAACAVQNGWGPDDGGFPVTCPAEEVIVGFGTSGQHPQSAYDMGLGLNVARNSALCAPVGNGYSLDRTTPAVVNSRFYGDTLTCPMNMVATAFCKSSGGNANCAPLDPTGAYVPDGPPVLAWLRCDTIMSTAPKTCPASSLWDGTECVQQPDPYKQPCMTGFDVNSQGKCVGPKR
jgi:hypothetical protein